MSTSQLLQAPHSHCCLPFTLCALLSYCQLASCLCLCAPVFMLRNYAQASAELQLWVCRVQLGLTLDQLDTLQQANVVEGSEHVVAELEEKKAQTVAGTEGKKAM